jgi:hypothetical protein
MGPIFVSGQWRRHYDHGTHPSPHGARDQGEATTNVEPEETGPVPHHPGNIVALQEVIGLVEVTDGLPI